MYHLDNESGTSTMPPIPEVRSADPCWFTDNPPSYPGPHWYNIVQAELLNVLKDAAIEPQKNALNQLSQAIQSMIFGGLPVGIPLPYPVAIPPAGFLKCNGAAFNKTQYPKLALVYPSGVLPDLRGEFIRGWDDGRGVNSGRAILSAETATSITQAAGNILAGSGQDIQNYDAISSFQAGFSKFKLVNEPWGTGVNYVTFRPRNVAFNYIVRAA